jgi:hypothetical protein
LFLLIVWIPHHGGAQHQVQLNFFQRLWSLLYDQLNYSHHFHRRAGCTALNSVHQFAFKPATSSACSRIDSGFIDFVTIITLHHHPETGFALAMACP